MRIGFSGPIRSAAARTVALALSHVNERVAGGPVAGQVRRRDAIAHCPKRFGEWRP